MDRWNVAAKVAAASSAVLAVGLLLTGFFAWRATDRKVLGLQLQQASAQLDGNLAVARAMFDQRFPVLGVWWTPPVWNRSSSCITATAGLMIGGLANG
jgi:hypothetical protein